MDNRFSCAIHTLILIAKASEPMDSAEIAQSVGTNASYIRKILAALKKAGLIASQQGKKGFVLLKDPKTLSLSELLNALYPAGITLFPAHKNPNPLCPVGRHIKPVLNGLNEKLQEKVFEEFKETTLQDCMDQMLAALIAEGTFEYQ